MIDKDIRDEFEKLHEITRAIYRKLFEGNGDSLTTQVSKNTDARVSSDKRIWAVVQMFGSVVVGTIVRWVWFR